METVEDALQMMLAHPISAVGQHLTTYETLMQRARKVAEENVRNLAYYTGQG